MSNEVSVTPSLPEKRREREEKSYLPNLSFRRDNTMQRKQSSYVWQDISAAGRNHQLCIYATREIGKVWRTLSRRGGYTWMGEASGNGAIVTANRKEEVGHLLRKQEVQA